MKRAVLGIDGGGTRSRGVLLSLAGEVVAIASSGATNYLAEGTQAASDALRALVAKLLDAARAGGWEVVAGGYGLSGLDRPKDRDAFAEMLGRAGATGWPFELVNDAFLALRAGTPDGVGVAAVSGTGCNTVGVDAQGRRERVGGLAWEFGDFGGADDIGVAALRAAFRGQDGRGPATALTARLGRELGIPRLEDAVDRLAAGARSTLDPGSLAPAVFETAEQGDGVAREILERAGTELGGAAAIVAGRLFTATDAFALVLGGRVLQDGVCEAMRAELIRVVQARFPNARPTRLRADPVLGAALLAIDRLAPPSWPDPRVVETARTALAQEAR
jgi:N-acetylglucosamine kinase-like BadF-type ATPase